MFAKSLQAACCPWVPVHYSEVHYFELCISEVRYSIDEVIVQPNPNPELHLSWLHFSEQRTVTQPVSCGFETTDLKHLSVHR